MAKKISNIDKIQELQEKMIDIQPHVVSSGGTIHREEKKAAEPVEPSAPSEETPAVETDAVVDTDTAAQTEETSPKPAPPIVAPVPVEIDIDKTLGNAVYSEMVAFRATLLDFKLDVSKEPLKEVVHDAVADAVFEYHKERDRESQERIDKLRAEGKPATMYEVVENAMNDLKQKTAQNNAAIKVMKEEYKLIEKYLREIQHKVLQPPVEKPPMPKNWAELRKAIYQIPWYYIKRVYFSWHLRKFIKSLLWSGWLISVAITLLLARDNAEKSKVVQKYNFVKAYYATDEKVSTMLLIFDGLFSDPEMNAAEIDTMSMVIRNKNAKLQPKQ